jgi:sorting nexin-27
MQDFLAASDDQASPTPSENKVEVRVLLPDRSIASVKVLKNSMTVDVYRVLAHSIGLSHDTAVHFALFKEEGYNFARKLQPQECPYVIYTEGCSSGSIHSSTTCLILKKWVFSKACEESLCSDLQALNYLYCQALDDISHGVIEVADKLSELRFLKDTGRKMEYLDMVRQLTGYGEISLPHCACDARKGGHVIAIAGTSAFKLQACKEDGTAESQVIEFAWNDILQYDVDTDQMSFNFEYHREGRKPRLVRIFTPYNIYLRECFDQIRMELEWEKEAQ